MTKEKIIETKIICPHCEDGTHIIRVDISDEIKKATAEKDKEINELKNTLRNYGDKINSFKYNTKEKDKVLRLQRDEIGKYVRKIKEKDKEIEGYKDTIEILQNKKELKGLIQSLKKLKGERYVNIKTL